MWFFFFGYDIGLEEGGLAEGKAKNMPATCFLARGRVHGSTDAACRAVDDDPYIGISATQPGGLFFLVRYRTQLYSPYDELNCLQAAEANILSLHKVKFSYDHSEQFRYEVI